MNDVVQTWDINHYGRDFVVGDIHGHFHVLERLLEQIDFDPQSDRLFSVGDLIDRGPESHRAAEFIDRPWFHAIRGNHEQMMCDALLPYMNQQDARDLWQINGGDWFERVGSADRSWLLDAVLTLPLAMEVELPAGDNAVILHADVYGDDWPAMCQQLEDADEETVRHTALWSRERARSVQDQLSSGHRQVDRVEVAGASVVFFGHTPMTVPVACENTRWIDTGVFLSGGHLSVAELAVAGRVWSLPVHRDKLYSGWRVLASGSDDQARLPTSRRSRWALWRR